MRIRRFFVILTLFMQSAWPQTAAPVVLQTPEQAGAQRAQADSLRIEAERRYIEAQNACQGKFLLSDCLDAAKKSHSKAMIEARSLEKGVRDFEREEHRSAVEAREAEHRAELGGRDAEQKAQGVRYRAEEARKAEEREQKLAEKLKQAEAGRRKTEAEQASRQEKQAKRAKQDAGREAKKAAKAVNADAVSTSGK